MKVVAARADATTAMPTRARSTYGTARAAVLVSLLAVAVYGDALASGLSSPFTTAMQAGTQPSQASCPSPGPPPLTLELGPIYSDRSGQVLDAGAVAIHAETMAPVRQFKAGLWRLVAAYQQRGTASPATARCALQWIAAWARLDALGQKTPASLQLEFERKWLLASIASAMLRFDNAALAADSAATAEARAWVGRLAENLLRSHGPGGYNHADNHMIWASYAAASAAVVLQDRALLDYARRHFVAALGRVDSSGLLSPETARGQRALHYHVFSMAPLVMTAEIPQANGMNAWSHGRIHAIGRLAGLLVQALEPATARRLFGGPQDDRDLRNCWHWGWAEPYFLRTLDQRVAPILLACRPRLGTHEIGDDLTYQYGAALPALAAATGLR